jgi:tRNA nucleotidyltransferase/poly(A) polymerase
MKKIEASIPVPDQVRLIAKTLQRDDPLAEVYVVGGAVRDYLYHQFHGDLKEPFKFKDVDTTTNLSEEEILKRLRSEEARKCGIRVKEKESVDTFGVVFVSVNGDGPYEVAPFRKDIGSSDGRRPDRVESGTIQEDAARRDLTINNLYYDFNKGEILDFNPEGQGVEDIKNKVVRTVGNPFERFAEDKLRILRMVRFFSRYNDGSIVATLNDLTLSAISCFRKLHNYSGMSHERVQTEFVAGIVQSINTASYLKNYRDLELFDAVFGDRPVDLAVIDRIDNIKSVRVILAMLLRIYDDDVGDILNALKWPNEVIDPVTFLIDAMNFNPENAVDVIKARDRRVIKAGKKKMVLDLEEIKHNCWVQAETEADLRALISLTDDQ